MDREVGDQAQRSIQPYQFFLQTCRLAGYDHLAREAQRPVEPSMPQPSSVGVHAQLHRPRIGRELRAGPHLQAGGVGVPSCDQHTALLRAELASHGECPDGGALACDKVKPAWLEFPLCSRLQLRKTGLDQARLRLQHGVSGRARVGHEAQEVLARGLPNDSHRPPSPLRAARALTSRVLPEQGRRRRSRNECRRRHHRRICLAVAASRPIRGSGGPRRRGNACPRGGICCAVRRKPRTPSGQRRRYSKCGSRQHTKEA
mmetsp:Transcript_62401/g.179024  ORF Transcript_62401/g.179024 Transcript_62401/m.179024 type:complete len:259 (-) Transcript_62401:63-839(-)